VQKECSWRWRRGKPVCDDPGMHDSRVPPELLFDAGFGELFVIRVAGNVISPEVRGLHAICRVHLKTMLFVVLVTRVRRGHAAMASRDEGVEHRSRIQVLVENIIPACLNPIPVYG